MVSIKHLFHINASKDKVYNTVSTIEGLSNWWTTDTKGESRVGGIITFTFAAFGSHDWKVTEQKPNELVSWECINGPADWVGTTITFKLDESDGKTRVRFSQDAWKEANDFYAGCNFSWGRYMESLRQLCQTGKGEAYGSPGYRK